MVVGVDILLHFIVIACVCINLTSCVEFEEKAIRQGDEVNKRRTTIFADDDSLLLEEAMIENELMSVEGQGATCSNNEDWRFSKYTEWGCTDIEQDVFRRERLCSSEPEVRINCKFSCGICCEDDPSYQFRVSDGTKKDCEWLMLSDLRWRQSFHCNKTFKGRYISSGCPKACDACFEFIPALFATESPTGSPSLEPTTNSFNPSSTPSIRPSLELSSNPTGVPSDLPTSAHSSEPSLVASTIPTQLPSVQPSKSPTKSPSFQPSESFLPSTSQEPSSSPSSNPSSIPSSSIIPSSIPSRLRSEIPSSMPSLSPSYQPSESNAPSASPSSLPTGSSGPSSLPSVSKKPSSTPTVFPSTKPSAIPSSIPSSLPSTSQNPTAEHSSHPSNSINPTLSPSSTPSKSPSLSPTTFPSLAPSHFPSVLPSATPSSIPSMQPSKFPSVSPTVSFPPSSNPSVVESSTPSTIPSAKPSNLPSVLPSLSPSDQPSFVPSSIPSTTPSAKPSNLPSSSPTNKPSTAPSDAPTSLPEPNLIMIITDEHNIKTLSCYRDYLLSKHSQKQVDVWGINKNLDTPNIDSLARNGALYSNYYTVSPLCTPSRGSFFSGMFPPFNGAADQNHGKLDVNIKTWPQILKERGYTLGYFGKWHLDGEEKPGWGAPIGREFGFDDNKYRFNRGHWKYFDELNNGKVKEYDIDAEGNLDGKLRELYATDFLMDKSLAFMENAVKNEKPFSVVVSIPDPHSPNENRPYYRTMFENMNFKVPDSARKNLKKDPSPPGYVFNEDIPIEKVDEELDEYERSWFTMYLQQYYGMVKCIDYNIGKMLEKIESLGVTEDTIIVFTSDHGDLLQEHGRMNKGMPYEASAGIPMLVQYPRRVKGGKVIETAYSSVDFGPTLLSLMGIRDYSHETTFQGMDGSKDLISDESVVNDENNIVFSFETGNTPNWAAAISAGYKLVLSNDVPWLFDLNRDPEEMINFATSPAHKDIFNKLRDALISKWKEYKAPLITERSYTIYLDMPNCLDSKDLLPLTKAKPEFCSSIGDSVPFEKCEKNYKIRNMCSKSCNDCVCEDSPGMMWIKGEAKTCQQIGTSECGDKKVKDFCRSSCGVC